MKFKGQGEINICGVEYKKYIADSRRGGFRAPKKNPCIRAWGTCVEPRGLYRKETNNEKRGIGLFYTSWLWTPGQLLYSTWADPGGRTPPPFCPRGLFNIGPKVGPPPAPPLPCRPIMDPPFKKTWIRSCIYNRGCGEEIQVLVQKMAEFREFRPIFIMKISQIGPGCMLDNTFTNRPIIRPYMAQHKIGVWPIHILPL